MTVELKAGNFFGPDPIFKGMQPVEMNANFLSRMQGLNLSSVKNSAPTQEQIDSNVSEDNEEEDGYYSP
jgi:hypothetical protein